MTRKGVGLLWAGALFIALGIGLRSACDIPNVAFIAFLNAGFIAILISAFRLRKSGEPIQDERTRRITMYSLSMSWFSTLILVSVLVWVHLSNVIELDVMGVLAIILFFMSVTGYLFKYMYLRRGDVE